MSALTVQDAAQRQPVRLPDGRTARLLSVPAQSTRPSAGTRARVLLPSGAVLSFPIDLLELEP